MLSAEQYYGGPESGQSQPDTFDAMLAEKRAEELAQVRAELSGASQEAMTPERQRAVISEISKFIVGDLRLQELPPEAHAMLQDVEEAA